MAKVRFFECSRIVTTCVSLAITIVSIGCGNGNNGAGGSGIESVWKPEPRTIYASEFDCMLSWGIISRDVTLTNNEMTFQDIDIMVTLRNSEDGRASQKTWTGSRWRQGEIIKIEGFDGGDWNQIEIKGDAKSGEDIVEISMESGLVRREE